MCLAVGEEALTGLAAEQTGLAHPQQRRRGVELLLELLVHRLRERRAGVEADEVCEVTGTGLKKCTPTTLSGRFVTAAIFTGGMEEVLLARMGSGCTTSSSLRKSSSLRCSTSGAASTTSSRSAFPD
jgi:hypothetical protein